MLEHVSSNLQSYLYSKVIQTCSTPKYECISAMWMTCLCSRKKWVIRGWLSIHCEGEVYTHTHTIWTDDKPPLCCIDIWHQIQYVHPLISTLAHILTHMVLCVLCGLYIVGSGIQSWEEYATIIGSKSVEMTYTWYEYHLNFNPVIKVQRFVAHN